MCCASPRLGPLRSTSQRRTTLIRRFDFTLLRRNNFAMWPEGRRLSSGKAIGSFTARKSIRGWLHTRPRAAHLPASPKSRHLRRIARWAKTQKYVEFIAHDWRKSASRDLHGPKATTNYFRAHGNSLPSSCLRRFFGRRVILKYKTDKDKYTVGEAGHHLPRCVASAGLRCKRAVRIFAYICYLRNLPYAEQSHWHSYNEAPEAGISSVQSPTTSRASSRPFKDPLRESCRL